MILNLQGVVDKELLVSQLSFVRDSKETVELAAKEDQTTLESAVDFAKNEIKDVKYNPNVHPADVPTIMP